MQIAEAFSCPVITQHVIARCPGNICSFSLWLPQVSSSQACRGIRMPMPCGYPGLNGNTSDTIAQ